MQFKHETHKIYPRKDFIQPFKNLFLAMQLKNLHLGDQVNADKWE